MESAIFQTCSPNNSTESLGAVILKYKNNVRTSMEMAVTHDNEDR